MVIVAVVLVIRIALPTVLEWALPRVAAGQNLYAEIGNIDLGLIVGEISLENLIVDFPPASDAETTSLEGHHAEKAEEAEEAEDAQPLLSLDRVHVAFEWTDLLFGRIHITDLELFHPVVEVTQLADGRFELPLLAPDAPDSPEAPNEEVVESEAQAVTDPVWEFMLDRFELNNPDLVLRSEAEQTEVVRLAADQLGFDALFVGPEGVELGGIDIEHPELFIQRRWLLGLDQAPAAEEPIDDSEAADGTPAETTAIHIKHLNIQRAAFTVRTEEGPIEVALRLALTDAGTEPDHIFPIDLGIEVDDAKIGIEGQLGLNPTSFSGQLRWENLSVPPFLLLAYPDLVPWLASCEASGELQIGFRSVPDAEPAGLTASGSTAVDNLSFKHPESGELALEWNSLGIDIREVFVPLEPTAEEPIRFELSRLTLRSPRIKFTNPPDALDDLLAALGDGSAPHDSPEAEQTSEIQSEPGSTPMVVVSQIELTDGTLRYVDRSVKPVHETKIHKLRVRIDALTTLPTVGANAISVDGLIQSAGSFKLRGALPDGQGKLDFALKQLDLVSYDSLAAAAGWQIESGSTSLDSNIIANDGRFETKNELVLHDLDVAAKGENEFSSRFGMPADLALALLRDPSGDITISAPITFDEEGAGVDLGPIILSALRSALQGAIASPLKMLGMFVPKGSNTDTLGALLFAPGEDEPGHDVRAQLESLAAFVENRPMLGLSLDGHWSTDDRTPMARQILKERADSGGDFPEVEGASFFARRRVTRALRLGDEAEDALSADDQALLEKYVAAEQVPEARFRSLAETRSQSLRRTLIELGTPAKALSIGTMGAADQPSVTIALDSRREPVVPQATIEN
jgi:hypothetical protein